MGGEKPPLLEEEELDGEPELDDELTPDELDDDGPCDDEELTGDEYEELLDGLTLLDEDEEDGGHPPNIP